MDPWACTLAWPMRWGPMSPNPLGQPTGPGLIGPRAHWARAQWAQAQWACKKRAGRPGQPRAGFFSKMDFYRPQLSQNISNDKDNDQQDVSSLAFFAKHRLVNRLFKFRSFLFGSIFDFLVKHRNDLFDAPQAYQRSVSD